MIIDSHTHIWSMEAVDYYDNKPLMDYMRENNIDKSALIAISEKENAEVKEAVLKDPNIFFGIAYVDHIDQERSLKRLRVGVEEGYIKGVKFYPYAHHYMLDSEELMPIYETCLELDIPALFHVGWQRSTLVHPSQAESKPCKYSTLGYPVQFGNVLERFPELKVVLAHMGANYYFECLGMAQRFENVFLDTSWLEHYASEQLPSVTVQEWIEHTVKYLGSKRILFGGEGTLPRDMEQTSLSTSQLADILGNNAAKLYKL